MNISDYFIMFYHSASAFHLEIFQWKVSLCSGRFIMCCNRVGLSTVEVNEVSPELSCAPDCI